MTVFLSCDKSKWIKRDLVKRDDGLRMNTDDCKTRSVAKEQLGKKPQKHGTDFFVLLSNSRYTGYSQYIFSGKKNKVQKVIHILVSGKATILYWSCGNGLTQVQLK